MGASIDRDAIRRSNDYAAGLINRLADCQTDSEVVAICKETEKAVMKLQTVNPARFHHVVNLVQLRRAEFARAHDKETKEQQEFW